MDVIRWFRRNIKRSHVAFSTVPVVTQIAISNGGPLFQVGYADNLDVSDHVAELMDEDSDT